MLKNFLDRESGALLFMQMGKNFVPLNLFGGRAGEITISDQNMMGPLLNDGNNTIHHRLDAKIIKIAAKIIKIGINWFLKCYFSFL